MPQEPYWLLNHDLRIIFLHNPKAAGTSIMRALGMSHCQDGEESRDQGHPTQDRLRVTHARWWWHKYFKLAWVRHPMSRAISAYHFSKDWTPPHGTGGGRAKDCELLKDKSFEDCLRLLLDRPGELRQPMWHPQSHFISEPFEFDFIGRYEQLESDWQVLCDRLGYDLFLPKLNPSTAPTDIGKYHTPFAIAAVEHIYKADYAAFGYKVFGYKPSPRPQPEVPAPAPAPPCGTCGGQVKRQPIEVIDSPEGIVGPAMLKL